MVVTEIDSPIERNGYTITKGTLSRKGSKSGDLVPYVLFSPKGAGGKRPVDIVISPEGKAGLVKLKTGEPIELVQGLLAAGHDVLSIDCFLTGEYSSPFVKVSRPHPEYKSVPRQFRKDYEYCYNHSDQQWRVQDILTAIGVCSSGKYSEVNLAGMGRAGLWCLMARPLAKGVSRTVVDAAQFDVENDENWKGELEIAGIRRAGDFRTASALIAPDELFIHNTGSKFKTDWAVDAYRAEDALEKLTVRTGRLCGKEIAAYLVR